MSAIIYFLIANNSSTAPIVEVTLAEGNFQVIAQKLLRKLPRDTSTSYSYENKYMFHSHNSEGITLMCMTVYSFSNRKAYALIFDVKDKFIHQFGAQVSATIAYGAQSFAEVIKERMRYYSSESSDKIAESQANLDRTREILIENVNKLLERGEKIEVMVEKTQHLSDEAVFMRKTAVKVKRHMWWKNFKMQLLMCLVLAV